MQQTNWETEISDLLTELSHTQDQVLALLAEKRQMLLRFDNVGLQALVPREEELVSRLQTCLERRGTLLQHADEAGLPHENLQSLAAALPASQGKPLARDMARASSQARILRHQSITHWVLVQRSLIHLAQMLEIIATGGRSQPTYGKGATNVSSGGLVDQAA
jgi:hypothetical protein